MFCKGWPELVFCKLPQKTGRWNEEWNIFYREGWDGIEVIKGWVGTPVVSDPMQVSGVCNYRVYEQRHYKQSTTYRDNSQVFRDTRTSGPPLKSSENLSTEHWQIHRPTQKSFSIDRPDWTTTLEIWKEVDPHYEILNMPLGDSLEHCNAVTVSKQNFVVGDGPCSVDMSNVSSQHTARWMDRRMEWLTDVVEVRGERSKVTRAACLPGLVRSTLQPIINTYSSFCNRLKTFLFSTFL